MRVCLAVFLVLAACEKHVDPDVALRSMLPADRLVVTVESGDVEVLSDGGPDLRATDKALVNAEDGKLTLKGPAKVIAPNGTTLVVVSHAGNVALKGDWGEVDVHVRGGGLTIDAAVKGGKLNANSDLEGTLREPPAADLTCESQAGGVRIGMAATFRGSINLRSGAGKIDAKRHARMMLKHDSTDNNVSGFVGPPLTLEERREKRWPPGFWAHAKTGPVSFELVDG